MKGKLLITTFIISTFLLVIVIFYNNQWNQEKQNIDIDFFVNNITWDTWIKKQIPYKKWDEIEISLILKNYTKYKLMYDIWIEKIIEILKLTNVNIITENNDLNSKDARVIKITGTTQNSWITPDNLNELVELDNKESIKAPNVKDEKDNNDIIQNETIDKKNKYDINLSKYEIINNESSLITLTWQDLRSIKWIWIWEVVYFVKNYSWINYITIEEKTLNRWIHLIYFLLNNDELRASNSSMNVKSFEDEVYVSNIMPNRFSNQNSRRITVQWKWLKNTISIQLNNNKVFQKVDFKIVSDTVLALNIWKNFPVWTYNMNIMTLEWIYEIKDYNFTVTE